GHGTVPRPAGQPGAGHSLLYVEQVGCNPANLSEPGLARQRSSTPRGAAGGDVEASAGGAVADWRVMHVIEGSPNARLWSCSFGSSRLRAICWPRLSRF